MAVPFEQKNIIVKLLILDNCSAVYGRLLELLGGIERLGALSIACSLAELPEKLIRLQPNVIVMDVDLPDGCSLLHIKKIRRQMPSARLYIFTNHYEYKNHTAALEADAFFDKSLEYEQLIVQLLKDAEQLRTALQKEGFYVAQH